MECKYYKFWNHSPKCPRSPDYYIKITSQFSFLWIFRSFCNHSSQSLHNNNLDIFVFAIFGKFWEFCRPNVRKLRGYSVFSSNEGCEVDKLKKITVNVYYKIEYLFTIWDIMETIEYVSMRNNLGNTDSWEKL